MLDEVELLVAGGGPEVFADDDLLVALRVTFLVHEQEALLLAEGRIGEDHRVLVAPRRRQAVVPGVDDDLVASNAVEMGIHRTHAPDLGGQLHTFDQIGLQPSQLIPIEILPVPVEHVLVGVAEEAAGARRRVTDAIVRCRLHHFAHGPDDWTGREVLAGAARGLLGRAGEQLLVDRALHVHRQRQPVHVIEQVDDDLLQECGVVYLAARPLEDDAEHPALRAQLLETGTVLLFQRRAVEVQQRLPAELPRHNRFAFVGRLRELIRHLEEQQQGQLLDVLEAGKPGVAQHAGVAPGPLADLRSVHARQSLDRNGQWVSDNPPIGGQELEALLLGLNEEELVERVFMIEWGVELSGRMTCGQG